MADGKPQQLNFKHTLNWKTMNELRISDSLLSTTCQPAQELPIGTIPHENRCKPKVTKLRYRWLFWEQNQTRIQASSKDAQDTTILNSKLNRNYRASLSMHSFLVKTQERSQKPTSKPLLHNSITSEISSFQVHQTFKYIQTEVLSFKPWINHRNPFNHLCLRTGDLDLDRLPLPKIAKLMN